MEKPSPSPPNKKDVEIGPGQADAAGERDGAAVNEVGAVAVDEIGKARGTTDAGEGDDLLVIELAFLEDLVIGSENGEVAAAGTPGRVIGGDGFLGEFLAGEFGVAAGLDGGSIVVGSVLMLENSSIGSVHSFTDLHRLLVIGIGALWFEICVNGSGNLRKTAFSSAFPVRGFRSCRTMRRLLQNRAGGRIVTGALGSW